MIAILFIVGWIFMGAITLFFLNLYLLRTTGSLYGRMHSTDAKINKVLTIPFWPITLVVLAGLAIFNATNNLSLKAEQSFRDAAHKKEMDAQATAKAKRAAVLADAALKQAKDSLDESRFKRSTETNWQGIK